MRVIITKVLPLKIGSKGGTYRRAFFKDENGSSYRLDVYDKNSSSFRFNEYLHVGAVFENMNVLDKKKKILDGNSPFLYVGSRQGKRTQAKSQVKLF